MQNRLLKMLIETAARELKVTKGINPQWAEKADLLLIAHGFDAIEADYRDWIESVRASRPDNPATDYLRIVDSRLANTPQAVEQSQVDLDAATATDRARVNVEMEELLRKRREESEPVVNEEGLFQ